MEPSDRERLLREIAEVENRLAHLSKQKEEAETSLQALQDRLAEGDEQPARHPKDTASPSGLPATTLTPEDKVALFLHLFRGRHDVYPTLWRNQKTGKKGYSPACGNEWVRGICEKPRVKCGECLNQAFLMVTATTVLDHLQGRHVIGAYPMLKDETCYFLAVDFDKDAWREDVLAFTKTCRGAGIAYAIERSRSGNGAHVWFFFDKPVPAGIARTMGSYLITETMARRHQLSMASYDRLFPNQDTLPNGGFGNLIALPLQYHARQEGNTVFLDDSLEPFPDQWEFLASLVPISAEAVETIAITAARRDQVIGVQAPDTGEDGPDVDPWLRLPSRKQKQVSIKEKVCRRARGAKRDVQVSVSPCAGDSYGAPAALRPSPPQTSSLGSLARRLPQRLDGVSVAVAGGGPHTFGHTRG